MHTSPDAETFKKAIIYSLWAKAIHRELYPAFRFRWLSLHHIRFQNQRLTSLMPLIVDGAQQMPSGQWVLPEGEQPRLSVWRQPMTEPRYQEILIQLSLNPYVMRFFQNVVDLESQHRELARAEATVHLRHLAQHNRTIYEAVLRWEVIITTPFSAARCPIDTIKHLIYRARRLSSQRSPNLPSQTISNAPSQIPFQVSGPIVKIPLSAGRLIGDLIQQARANMHRLHAEEIASIRLVMENGQMIRSQLRAALASSESRALSLQLQRQHLYQLQQQQHLLQSRTSTETAMASPVTQDQLQPSAQDLQINQRPNETRSVTQRGMPSRPLTQRATMNIARTQPKYGDAVEDIRWRIGYIRNLQEATSRSYRNILPRNETCLLQTTGRLPLLIYLENQRLRGHHSTISHYHLKLHEFSLREALIVKNRKEDPERAIALLQRLETWLLSAKEDLAQAARIHGSQSLIPRGWAFPPWPVGLEVPPFGRRRRRHSALI